MQLLQGEEYLLRNDAEYKKKNGKIGLTSYRLIWASAETMEPDLMFSIMKIEECKTAWKHDTAKLKISGIDLNNTRRVALFTFTGNSAKDTAELCENWIKRLKVNSQKIQLVSDDSQFKMKFLEQNREIYELHKKLVRNGNLQDEDFWKYIRQYHQFCQKQLEGNLLPGKLQNVIKIPCRRLLDHVSIEQRLIYKQQIFRQYPSVKVDYQKSVPHHKSESEFWSFFYNNLINPQELPSDSLEIAMNVQFENKLDPFNDQVSAKQGIFKVYAKQNKLANYLIDRINLHSINVISNCSAPQQLEATYSPQIQYINQRQSIIIQNKLESSQEWKEKLINFFKTRNPKQVFPTPNKSGETFRQNLRQLYPHRQTVQEKDDVACSYSQRISQILHIFYKQLPASSQNIHRLKQTVQVAQQLYNQMQSETHHQSSLLAVQAQIEMAANRISYIESQLN